MSNILFRRTRFKIALVASLFCASSVALTSSQPLQARALTAQQVRADALVDRAARLYLQEKYADSLALCRQATQITPNYPRAWVGFATTLAALNQRDEAGRAFRQALKVGATGADRARAQNGLRKLGLPLRGAAAAPVVPIRTIAPFAAWKAVRTFRVAPDGEIKSIAQAIRNAPPFSRIEVAAGTYNESLIVDKPLQIVGSKLGDVIVQNVGAPCLSLRTNGATVARLVFQAELGTSNAETSNAETSNAETSNVETSNVETSNAQMLTNLATPPNSSMPAMANAANNRFHAVEIPRGRSLLTNCEVRTQSRVGISAYGSSTRALIVACKISGARTSGIVVFNRARADIDGCEVSGSAYAGVEVFEGGNAFLRACRLFGNRTGAISETTATLLLQGCVVQQNAWQGVRVEPYGSLFLRRTVVKNNARNISRALASVFVSIS